MPQEFICPACFCIVPAPDDSQQYRCCWCYEDLDLVLVHALAERYRLPPQCEVLEGGAD